MTTDEESKALVEKLRGNADSHGRGMPLARRITGDHLSAAADTIEALSAKVAELTIQLRVVRLDRDGAVKRMEVAEKQAQELRATGETEWIVTASTLCDRLGISRSSEAFHIVNGINDLRDRTEAAEKRLAEVEAQRAAKDEQYWLVAENEAKLQEHSDRLESALRPFAEYLDTAKFDLDNNGNPLPDEQGMGWVYLTVGDFRRAKDALSGSSDPRKDVARLEHAVEFTAKMCWRTDPPNANNRLTDSERLSAIKHHPTIKEYGKPNAALDPKEGTDAGE